MAEASEKSGFCSRKRRVRKFSNPFELLQSLTPKAQVILKALGAENSERDAARAAQCAKSTVTYWKDKFLDLGLLQLVCRDVFQIFKFTPFGSKVATGSEVSGKRLVLEDHAVKFEVLSCERRRIVWKKLGSPKNWEKLGCFVSGVRVVRTSGSVIIHPGRLRGFEGEEVELGVMSGRVVEWVRTVLEGRFGMLLSSEGVELHKPIFRYYSEEAKEDVKHGTVIVEGVGSVDNSPPERVPHEEYLGVERARARLLLPDSAKRLELKVDELTKVTGSLADSVTKLVDMFKQAINPEAPIMPKSLNEIDYVS